MNQHNFKINSKINLKANSNINSKVSSEISLKATCKTVHLGGFSSELEPALVVDSGDRIEVETYTGFRIYDQAPAAFMTPELIEICQQLPSDRRISSGPHLLTGPIYLRDAQPGDTLEVRIEAASPRLAMGFNAIRPGWGSFSKQFSEPELRFIPLDLVNNQAEFPPGSGVQIPLHPFLAFWGLPRTNPLVLRFPLESMAAI